MATLRASISLLLIGLGLGGTLLSAVATAASSPPVVVIPIEGTVDAGMAHLVQRGIALANDEHAQAVVLNVNSNGGLVEDAQLIRDAIYTAKEPVIAYISRRAYSSAALISLSSNRIVMSSEASFGAAEPHVPTGSNAELVSALRKEFESAAERNHRNPTLAAAMVDKTVSVPEYKTQNGFLVLTTADALRTHMADAQADTLADALRVEHLDGAQIVDADYTWAERLARFATEPAITSILLTIGMLGLILEMQTMHGIAGTIGVLALGLFFGSHIYAGFSNGLVVALAIVGILGILWELHVVPGHGAPGILGGVALLASVLLAFGLPFFFVAVESVSTAIVLTVIAFVLLLRVFPENQWVKRLALVAAQGAEYVASRDFSEFRGAIGTAASFLRPAGIGAFEGKRVDVLTEGEFIQAGTPIRVTRVEGARIFVEPVALPSYK